MARLSDDYLGKVRMWLELGHHLRTIKMSDSRKKRTAIAFHVFRMWVKDNHVDTIKIIKLIGTDKSRTESEIKNDIELLKYFQAMYNARCQTLKADEIKKYIRGICEIDVSEWVSDEY